MVEKCEGGCQFVDNDILKCIYLLFYSYISSKVVTTITIRNSMLIVLLNLNAHVMLLNKHIFHFTVNKWWRNVKGVVNL